MLELNKIYQAKQKIADFIVKTPLAYAPFLSELYKAEIYLKKENLQLIKFAEPIIK